MRVIVDFSKLVVCCVMTREDFTRMIGNLQDIIDGHGPHRLSGVSTLSHQDPVEYKLHGLEILNTLGQGAFGKVKLVNAKDTGVRYALKMLSKESIVEKHRERYLLSEFRLMKELKHPNIVFMHCAIVDDRYIYFLLDLLPGGEVTNILDRPVSNCEALTRFYSASVILAYTELYKHRIVYRDLKPENMLLDAKGYCVLVDFGLSKVIDGPTYTFCGTPDYMAPELIRGTGYTWAVDYWALGILLVRTAPFIFHFFLDSLIYFLFSAQYELQSGSKWNTASFHSNFKVIRPHFT
jgi:cGMP-dependent protein kinase